ncbi:MAG: YqeG family HAD IIIA-type phosphatase [Clostridia bacterium]|nr:YqeG family HAD IIIA-type phosphatase [Clostridia bacterium]
MKLKDYFIPDHYFPSVVRIKPEFFAENNIKCLICDIDNTLATYKEALPQKDVKDWLDTVEASGVRIALISNNREKRVYTFNSVLGYLYVSNAGKPFTGGMKKLMKQTRISPEQTALIGDQIFTDVLCAKRTGVRSILVRSIDMTGRPFLRMKKHFERYFMDQYYRKNNIY